MSVTLFRQARPYLPSFANGTTGGPSGTVTDGGQAGRVTFTLPTSGHADPSDGCWIAWPLRDVLRRSRARAATDLLSGIIRSITVTGPTAGKGVSAGVGIVAAGEDDPFGASSYSTLTGLKYKAARDIMTAEMDAGSYIELALSLTYGPTDGTVMTGLYPGPGIAIACYDSGNYGNARTRALNITTYRTTGAGSIPHLVAWAYREGASTGSESVTLDLMAAVSFVEQP